MSRGSTSISGRGTEPASAIGTLEKSGLPPGRTAGSGTCRLRRWDFCGWAFLGCVFWRWFLSDIVPALSSIQAS